jgi:hypothetical protein
MKKILLQDKRALATGTLLFGVIIMSIFPLPVFGQLTEYTLLEPLPLGPGNELVTKTTAPDFISGLFRLTIAIAGALAVLRLIYAGIIKMSSDAITEQNKAKGIISDAIWGLLLTMGAWVIVATVLPSTDGKLIFDLSLPRYELPAKENPGNIRTGVGCQGNCPYSYTNYKGDIVAYKDCASCSKANTFGIKIKPTIQVVNGKAAEINTGLGNKLKAVQATRGNPAFQITEAWPPTVNHKNQGQYDGTSVDVGLASNSAANIKVFLANAQAQGLSVVYEVGRDDQRDTLVEQGVPAASVIVVPYITAPHFSIK